jgi:hypothetical protein
VTTVDGASVLNELDLSLAINGQTSSFHEIEPSVDCDGQRFVVAYAEPVMNGTSPYTVYASQLSVSGAAIRSPSRTDAAGESVCAARDRAPKLGRSRVHSISTSNPTLAKRAFSSSRSARVSGLPSSQPSGNSSA